jgi:glycosyltransferase involved in cell wall biosynthesis
MRHLTVVQCVPALDSGGVEQTTIDIASAIASANHRSVVISAGGRLVPTLLQQGSEHIQLDIGKKSLMTFRHIASLQRCFENLRADIVHARSRLPAWLCFRALRKMPKAPHFVTSVHGLNSPGFYSGVMLRGEKIICVSQTVKGHVLKHWPSVDAHRISVIEPGVDTRKFNAQIAVDDAWRNDFFQRYGIHADETLLLLPGRGTRLKGHHAAIRLLASLRREGVKARLLFAGAQQAGRQDYLEELKRSAQALNVADKISITPAMSDMAQIYLLSNIVLQLSEKPEAFGRTVIEALSMGKPVLGWAHGGVGENLQQNFPFGAVPLNDHEALLQKSLSMLNGLGSEQQPKYHHAQTITTMQAQTLALYEQLVS